MLVLAVLLGACGRSEPTPIRSTPAPALAELKSDGPLGTRLVWSDLAELFPERPGMVRPLQQLTPGMAGEAARAVLARAKAKEAELTTEELVPGHRTTWSVLRHGESEVTVTLVFDRATDGLKTVDVTTSWGAASAVLGERWGAPDPGPPIVGGKAMARWSAEPWVVELHRLREGRGIIQFRAQEKT